MIGLTLNGKRESIPSAKELTVQQFIDLNKRDKIDIVNYLSVVMNIDYKAAFNLKTKNFGSLKKRVGVMPDYQKIAPVKKISLNDGNFFYVNNGINTVGERWMIEENARTLQDEELLIFILAVSLVSDATDFNKVNKMKELLLKQPYVEVLPTAFFLQLRFLSGRNTGLSFFKRLIFLIKMKELSYRRELRSFLSTLIILKYKLYLRY